MSIQEKLIDAIKDLDNESAEIVLQLVYKLTDSVEPDEREKEIAEEWFAMPAEEKAAGKSIEEVAREFGIEL